jgi:hypothetical protein
VASVLRTRTNQEGQIMIATSSGWRFAAYVGVAALAFGVPSLGLSWMGWVAAGMALELALVATR